MISLTVTCNRLSWWCVDMIPITMQGHGHGCTSISTSAVPPVENVLKAASLQHIDQHLENSLFSLL